LPCVFRCTLGFGRTYATHQLDAIFMEEDSRPVAEFYRLSLAGGSTFLALNFNMSFAASLTAAVPLRSFAGNNE
jgi:hypothetical protein